MNIYQMRYFVTAAQLQNVSKAAELLHLSQSSLSKSISRMEAELGMPLFERNGKKILLNKPGERFLECCNTVLRELDDAVADMNSIASSAHAKVRLGLSGGDSPLIGCVAKFCEEHPDAEFDVDRSIESLERVDINEYDALVYPAGMKYEKFSGFRLGDEHYYLAVSRASPLAARASVALGDLEGLRLVFLRGGKNYMEFPYRVCTALALPVEQQCFTDEREVQRQIISSGMAAGFVPDGSAAAYRNGSVSLIPINDPRFTRTMMICFRREKHLSPMARDFRDFAMDYLKLNKKGAPAGAP